MRRHKLIAVLAVLLLGTPVIWADSDRDGHSETVEQVLTEIRGRLGLSETERVDARRVPEELLQKLGDAAMGLMAGGDEQHEWMDRMMGGEGSESLTAAHRWMGYRYLTGGYGGMMMGPGMMGGTGAAGSGGMMGSGGTSDGWGMMGDRAVPYDGVPYDSPEQIAKRRYAQGELTREEYLQIIKDLEK